MLEGIFEFLQWLGSIIETIFNFFANLLSSFISFFKIIPTIIIFVTSSIGYLPSMVMVFATVGITVSILFLVLGRNNN